MKQTVLIIFLCLVCSNGWTDQHVFTGHVNESESYEYVINKDLVFRLVPNSAGNPPGWVITIAPADHSRDDYLWVVTPPYRFSNPRYVDTSYGLSAKEAVDWSPREFAFVINSSDYQTASNAVDTVLWPYNYSEKQIDEAMATLDSVPKIKGTLTITQASLSPMTDGSQEIESLDFKVELDLQ